MNQTTAKWIGTGLNLVFYDSKPISAPYFRQIFDNKSGARDAELRFCGLGYGELYVNGERINGELEPTVSRYDQRCFYRTFQIHLKPGKNVFGVILGNGFYNVELMDTWGFYSAPWRDYPKMFFELKCQNEFPLISDRSWRFTMDTPILFNGIRNGETYDANKEAALKGWLTPEYDDSSWKEAIVVPPPGGAFEEDIQPPVRVIRETPMRTIAPELWDAGYILSGRVKIIVRGDGESQLTLIYSDMLDDQGQFTQLGLAHSVPEGSFQIERITPSGKNTPMEYHSRFTFHGFRYVRAIVNGNIEILYMTAQEMRTDFAETGAFESSSPKLNQLLQCTLASYRSNFVGIPTDCPHREKNGWTADAAFAAETGLSFFDTANTYRRWLKCVADCQRPNGQLPGIVPSGGWGYDYGSGPVWDAALWLIPYYIWLYTGDILAIRETYDVILRHLDFLSSLAENHIIRFGIGDHAHPFPKEATPKEIILTCFYYKEAETAAKFARLLRKNDSVPAELAAQIKTIIQKNWSGCTNETALALFSEFGLGSTDAPRKLAQKIEENQGRAAFGIVGSKWIPRVLTRHGYVDTAMKIMLQPDYPGYGNWLKRGAQTLWEYWDGQFSRNHIMFGDIAAWMLNDLAGIAPDEQFPGFSKLHLRPAVPSSIDHVRAHAKIPAGLLRSSWKKENGYVVFLIETPVAGYLHFAGESLPLTIGKNQITLPLH